jgi:hypothetical protein
MLISMNWSRLGLLFVLVAGIYLRLVFFPITGAGSDIRNFATTGARVASGQSPYWYYYNYSPLPGFISGALYRLPFPFADSFRVFVAAVDLVNAALVYGILKRVRPRTAWIGFVLIWLSLPLLLYNALDAQFDALSLTPLLLALWILPRLPSACSALPAS